MNQGSLISRLATTPAPLVTAGVIVGAVLSLLVVFAFGLPIWSLLVLAGVLLYALLVVNRPTIGLFVVICAFFLPLQLGLGTLNQIVGVVTFSLVLIWFLRQRRTILLHKILIPLFLLGVHVLISFWFTHKVTVTTNFFRMWILDMIFILLLINMVTRFNIFKNVIWAIIIMGSVNALVGILEYSLTSEFTYRSAGLLANACEFGQLSSVAFPLAFYQFLYRTDRLKWLGLCLSAVLAAGVVVSVARGPTITLIVTILAILFLERRRIVPLTVVLALCLCIAPLFPDYFNKRVTSNLVDDIKHSFVLDDSRQLSSRGYLNKGGIRIWLSHPLLGVGVGNFGRYFVQRDINPGLQKSERVPPHSIYLQALVEMGTIGFLILIWLIIATMRNLLQVYRSTYENSSQWAYFGGVTMMTLAAFVSNSTVGNLFREDFWLFVGLAAVGSQIVSLRAARESSNETPSGDKACLPRDRELGPDAVT